MIGTEWQSGARRFSHRAMATLFEVVCVHQDEAYARQASLAAFDLVDRLEQELSRFIDNSDIGRIGNAAPGETVRVSRWTMECLQLARLAHAVTGGAFDISLGRGWDSLELDPSGLTVQAPGGGVALDLGGIGKGYAVDRMAEVLDEWDIRQAILHGGYSSVLALEAPVAGSGWPLTMTVPGESAPFKLTHARYYAFSASGAQKEGHIRDPRTGQPAPARRAAWAAAENGAMTDFCRQAGLTAEPPPAAVVESFSTAFMLLSAQEIEECCGKFPGLEAWIWEGGAVRRFGTASVPAKGVQS